MSFDYVARIGNVVNVLVNHNTTTASPDLSASMSTRIQRIVNDDPNIQGIRGDKTPAFFVSLNTASDEEEQMGANFVNRKKQKSVSYDIHGIYKKEGFSKEHESHITDFYQMANNLEAVLKAEATLSNTALHVELVDTDFKSDQPENSYVKVFKTTLNVRYFYS